eukprot:gnl/MRDRNA2_/MRDRNA2_58246_c0_seq1.p1 gnl/MRDRNA2_/MRDRNA2_58246_c0~~gnl/MRDRNA2_/MRDRNA2_58246_c0_seq1.p1  ORF type:complete len:924 (-),score=137.93 gnl/MRDRNA2_/MRDRNA2_58246_c0_seq1:122-2893(-)
MSNGSLSKSRQICLKPDDLERSLERFTGDGAHGEQERVVSLPLLGLRSDVYEDPHLLVRQLQLPEHGAARSRGPSTQSWVPQKIPAETPIAADWDDDDDPENDPRVRAFNLGPPLTVWKPPLGRMSSSGELAPPTVVPVPQGRKSIRSADSDQHRPRSPKARMPRPPRGKPDSLKPDVLEKGGFREGAQTLGSLSRVASMSTGHLNSPQRQRAPLESQIVLPGSNTEDEGESPVAKSWTDMVASGGSSGSRAAVVGAPSAGLGPLGTAPLLRGWAKWHNILLTNSAKMKKKGGHKHKIVLLRSVFEDRPPTLLFKYSAAACGSIQRPMDRAITPDMLGSDADALPKMYYTHTEEVHKYNSVLNTLKLGGLYQARSGWLGKYALIWGAQPKPEALRTFHPYQKTNHFPLSWYLGRKDLLWRNISRMKRRWGPAYDIMPSGFQMPDEFKSWVQAREANPRAMWIFKPANGSCGRGIKVMTNQVSAATDADLSKRSGVVQRYIYDPLTINGYKFDLRLYVVVSSYDPLRIYLGDEGLVRFATEKYSASPKTLGLRNMHLTNYSVNKHSSNYTRNTDNKKVASSGGMVVASANSTLSSDAGHAFGNANNLLNSNGEQAEDTIPTGAERYEDGAEDGGNEGPESDGEHEGDGENCDEAGASKWSLTQLKNYFEEQGWDWDNMMMRIEDVVIKTVISAEPHIVTAWHQGLNFQGSGSAGVGSANTDDTSEEVGGTGGRWPNQTCFEAYGFDVLVDESLKPWLLEVNVSPSLSSSSPFDKRVKTMLIADALTLIGMKPFDYRTVEKEVREERLQRLRGLRPKATGPKAPLAIRAQEVLGCPNSELMQHFTEHDWQLIIETHEEYMRRGNLKRIFPTEENASVYADILPSQRYGNLVLRRWLDCGGPKCFEPGSSNPAPSWVPKMIHFNKT